METARLILDWEARRDARGRLRVYRLPSGDGGGTFEVAGINDRYHKQAAHRLRVLIEDGQHAEAEREAAAYIAKYTESVAGRASNPGVRLALQDAAFNRGPTGATRILQRALGVKVDGKFGAVSQAALLEAEKNPQDIIRLFRAAREWYEMAYAKRKPGNKFWNGLVNRWEKQLHASLAIA